ncbi:MAG: ABC transporter permease [Thermoanaerobaculales bacterium]|nr:ABC transporter permease [Thermoanaerobaculales bacterium]
MTTEMSTMRSGLTGTWGVFRGEVRRWMGWRGLFHLLGWTGLVVWFLYDQVFTGGGTIGLGFEILMNLLAVIPPMVGIVLVAAGICGSYHDGTTAWVIAKPVPRAGHVVATVGGLWVGVTLTTIVVPGLVAYWWLPKVEPYRFVAPEAPPFGRYLVALGGMSLVLAFFMALSALLSVVTRRRSVAMVVGFWALLMLLFPIGNADWLDFTPVRLIFAMPGGPGGPDWAEFTEYIHGAPFDAMDAVLGTGGLAAVFIAGAIFAFRRLEL